MLSLFRITPDHLPRRGPAFQRLEKPLRKAIHQAQAGESAEWGPGNADPDVHRDETPEAEVKRGLQATIAGTPRPGRGSPLLLDDTYYWCSPPPRPGEGWEEWEAWEAWELWLAPTARGETPYGKVKKSKRQKVKTRRPVARREGQR